jgi:hypothetical protein
LIEAVLKHPRRPTSSGPFEGQFGEAKSSMVADAISQNFYLDYHRSGNASRQWHYQGRGLHSLNKINKGDDPLFIGFFLLFLEN